MAIVSCSIDINYDSEIIYYQHYGTIDKNSILDAWNKVVALLEHQKTAYNLILDHRGALFTFQTSEIDDIVHFFYSRINLLHGKKIAGIFNIPHEAAIIKMLETLKRKEADFQVQIFQAMEAACRFLFNEHNTSGF